MRRYFLDYATSEVGALLARLLPRDDGQTLRGPGGSVIAIFTIDHSAVTSKPIVEYGRQTGDAYFSIFVSLTANTSVWADVDDEGLDDRKLVLRVFRELRDGCGGVLMDEDGRPLD